MSYLYVIGERNSSTFLMLPITRNILVVTGKETLEKTHIKIITNYGSLSVVRYLISRSVLGERGSRGTVVKHWTADQQVE